MKINYLLILLGSPKAAIPHSGGNLGALFLNNPQQSSATWRSEKSLFMENVL
jgi:hypothetical protein